MRLFEKLGSAEPVCGRTDSGRLDHGAVAHAAVQWRDFAVAQQPITLTIGNATTSGVRPLTYSFEVAVDVNFTNRVFTRGSITSGASGQTSLPLPSALATGYTYDWHAQAQDGANTGAFSGASSFTVFMPIVINAPVPVGPSITSRSAR